MLSCSDKLEDKFNGVCVDDTNYHLLIHKLFSELDVDYVNHSILDQLIIIFPMIKSLPDMYLDDCLALNKCEILLNSNIGIDIKSKVLCICYYWFKTFPDGLISNLLQDLILKQEELIFCYPETSKYCTEILIILMYQSKEASLRGENLNSLDLFNILIFELKYLDLISRKLPTIKDACQCRDILLLFSELVINCNYNLIYQKQDLNIVPFDIFKLYIKCKEIVYVRIISNCYKEFVSHWKYSFDTFFNDQNDFVTHIDAIVDKICSIQQSSQMQNNQFSAYAVEAHSNLLSVVYNLAFCIDYYPEENQRNIILKLLESISPEYNNYTSQCIDFLFNVRDVTLIILSDNTNLLYNILMNLEKYPYRTRVDLIYIYVAIIKNRYNYSEDNFHILSKVLNEANVILTSVDNKNVIMILDLFLHIFKSNNNNDLLKCMDVDLLRNNISSIKNEIPAAFKLSEELSQYISETLNSSSDIELDV